MGLDNPLHIAFIVVLVLLVFGAKRLPEIGRSLGTGMREFKQAITGESHNSTPTQAREPERPTLPSAAPPPEPAQQAPPPEAAQAPSPTQAEAQDAFAQRDPATTDRR